MSLLGNIWVKLGLKSDDFNKGLDTAERKTSKFGNAMKGIAAKVLTVAAALKVVASSFKTLANFEASASKLASVLGKTTGDIKDLTQSAIDLGRRTQYTASEVVGLQTELAKLGFVQDDIKAMQEGVLKFAAAVGTDLSSAAARAGATMRGFGLTADETNNMLNVMAVSTSKSALSFNYLDSTLGKLVPVTRAFGLDTESTIALLGTLANAGIDASSAGTSLRNILIQLSDKSSKLNQTIGKQPKTMEELIEAFQTLTDKHVGLEQAQDLVDKRSASVLLALMNNADACRELYGELQNANGALDEMYATMTSNVLGGINQVKSAWEGLILTLQNSTGVIASVLTRFARGLNTINDLANGMSLADSRVKQLGETIMQSGKFTTSADYRAEIDRVREQLAKGVGRSDRKTLEKYLEGLEFASFQKSQEEQIRSLENMFGGQAGIIGGITDATNEEADALESLLKGLKTEKKYREESIGWLQQEIQKRREARDEATDEAVIRQLNTEIEALQKKVELLNKVQEFQKIEAINAPTGALSAPSALGIDTSGLKHTTEEIDEFIKNFHKQQETAEDISRGFADAIKNGVVDSLEQLAEAIGTGDLDTTALVKALVSPLADMAISAGTLILSTGEGIEAIKKAFESLNGYAAIAAGASLVALGLALKAGMAALSKGGGGTQSAYTNPYTYAGGLGTAPAAGYGASIDVNVTGVLKGQDIYLASEQYQRNRGR